ncbi:MAG: hypothetical protein R6U96_15375 [Promethearchaeia archaeon]
MSQEYLLKVVLTGAPNSGKSIFLNGGKPPDPEKSPLGVNLRKVECLINEKQYFKLIIWELKATKPHLSLHSTYSRGATAAILTFSFTDRESFLKLPWWVKIIRKENPNIPFILLGTKADLPYEVSIEEIEDFMEKSHIYDFFEVSKSQDMREKVFKSLIARLELISNIRKFILVAPTYDERLKNFLNQFTRCPICNAKNHENYLKRFYFSLQPEIRTIKEQFLNALSSEKSSNSELQIGFGIPCCECFSKYFKH